MAKIDMKKLISCLIFISLFNINSFAEVNLVDRTLVITTTGIAYLGSGITEDNAKTLAINDAKRKAVELAGTYLESHKEILNFQVVKDEIITYSSGLVKLEVLKTEPKLINKRFLIEVNIKANVDTRILNERIKKLINNKPLKKELEETRKRLEKLEKIIAEIQTEKSKKTKQGVQKIIQALTAEEWNAKAFYTEDNNLKIKYYSEAILLDPSNALSYNSRGKLYSNLGQLQKAIEDFNQVIKINPNDAYAYNESGIAYARLLQYQRAIENFSKVIHIDPNNIYSYFNLGKIYSYIGSYQRAIENFSKAIKINPDYFEAYNKRGAVYYDLKQHQKAIEDLNQAIEINPYYADAYFERGIVYYDLKQHQKAIEDLNQVIDINPNDAFAYRFRGWVYAALGMQQKAIENFSKTIQLAPNDKGGYNDLAWLYATNNNLRFRNGEKSLQYALKAIELDKDQVPNLLDTLAAAYAENGEFFMAIQEQEKAIFLLKQEDYEQDTLIDFQKHLQSYKIKKAWREE